MTYGAAEYAGGLYGGPRAAAADTDTFPSLAVEIAFTSDPGDENPVWVDVTLDVRDMSISRGRQKELDQFQTGNMTVTLSNADRDYDPSYSSSPYNGFVKPMKRIRARATFGAVTYPLFDGYISSWDQQYSPPNDAVAVVSAADGFKPLNAQQLPSSAYVLEVLADSPSSLWRLNDPEDALSAWDSIGGRHATFFENPTSAASIISREAGGSTQFDHSNGNVAQYDGNTITGYPFTIDAVINIPTPSDTDLRVIYDDEYSSSFNLQPLILFVDNNDFGTPGQLVFQLANDTSSMIVVWSTSRVDDGQTHHVAVTVASRTEVHLYVDGVEQTTWGSTVDLPFPTGRYATGLGNLPQFDSTLGSFGLAGSLQMVAVYPAALSAARIAAHAEAVSTPWNDDTPAERINRLLDYADWPTSLRELDTGSSTLQSATIDGQTVLAHSQAVERSEFGELFMTRDGKVRLMGRAALVNRPELAIFGDDPSELGYTDLKFDFSDQLIRNEVTISRSEGKAQTVADTSSVADYLRHSYTRDGLLHDSDALSLSAAQFLVSEYKDPLLRVTSMTVAPQGAPTTLFPQVLGRELGEELTVRRRPQGVGSEIDRDCVIEGIRHTYSAAARLRWQTVFSLSPAYADSFWQLGIAGASELGSTTRLYF